MKGVIRGSVALFIGLDWLTRRYQARRPGDDTALALLDSKGELDHRGRGSIAARSRPAGDAQLICASICSRELRRFARAATTARGACMYRVRCSAGESS